MFKKITSIIIAIFIPLAIGSTSSFLTKNSVDLFDKITKPPPSPPSILFPIVWTILFILMGIASYLIYTSGKDPVIVKVALVFYSAQLIFNFMWPIFFFKYELYLFSFIWLLMLLLLILITAIIFYQISKPAGILLLPYLLWVSFAGYLNIAIYFLN